MPTTSPRLFLAKPILADDFDTSEIAANWQKVDDHPGTFICTSGTRPGTWGANHEGMFILETDTALLWRWNGTAFVRHGAVGHLDYHLRNSPDYTTSTADPEILVQKSVDIPAGDRNILITANWLQVTGDGPVLFAIYRGSTRIAGVMCAEDAGGSMSITDISPPAGTTTYSLRVTRPAGTNVTVHCDGETPISINVLEV